MLVKNKIPVMSHIGLQPQKVFNKKKFKVLGKKKAEEKLSLEEEQKGEKR